MKNPSCAARLPLLCATLFLLLPAANAKKPDPAPDHWVGSWATAPYSLDSPKVLADLGLGSADMTLRQIVHTSLAGPLARIELTNEFGTEPLTIGAAHVALAGPDGSITLTSAAALTFGGKPAITIPPGAAVVSDPVTLAVPAGGDLAISLFVPAQKISHVSYHSMSLQTSFLAPGNLAGAATLATPRKVFSWYFLKSVDVLLPGDAGAIVALGDSITDGAHASMNTNTRWPDVLARRLHADKATAGLGVLNEGIGGNRVLHDGNGPSALARFSRDVLALPGVKFVILMEGINDLGHAYDPKVDPAKRTDVVTADDLIQGYAVMAERAHEHGIKVIGATLTPYVGAKYASPAGEAERQKLNAWIRTSKLMDGVVDFDKATQDPAHPDTFRADADSGDQLHPKDAGYKLMGDAFDLKMFEPHPKEKYDIKVSLK